MARFHPEDHLIQLGEIPEGLVEFGPRDEVVVSVTRRNAAKEVIGRYTIPAKFVTIDTPNASLPAIDVFDLRADQLSFMPPPEADGYSYGDSEIRVHPTPTELMNRQSRDVAPPDAWHGFDQS